MANEGALEREKELIKRFEVGLVLSLYITFSIISRRDEHNKILVLLILLHKGETVPKTFAPHSRLYPVVIIKSDSAEIRCLIFYLLNNLKAN